MLSRLLLGVGVPGRERQVSNKTVVNVDKGRKCLNQIGAKDVRCIYVNTDSRFSVNYACLCVYHQTMEGLSNFGWSTGTDMAKRRNQSECEESTEE